MSDADRFSLEAIASSVGAHVGPSEASALRTWLTTLVEWNARIDLTAAKSDADVAELMLTDALVLATRLPRDATVVDVGTGAGAPGLGLALARPDLDVTLVEPLGKRVSFLRTVIGTVRRERVRVLSERGEVVADRATRFDVAISRATLDPASWLSLGARLIRDEGSVWALVTSEDVLASDCGQLRRVESVDYAMPFSNRTRVAQRFRVESRV